MFKPKYYLNVVNAEKGIVTLKPLKSTYIKAFAPLFVLWGAIGVAAAISRANDAKVVELDPDHPQS